MHAIWRFLQHFGVTVPRPRVMAAALALLLACLVLGMLLALPCALGFILWPAGGHWMLGSLRVPHALAFAPLFAFFASWWPSLSYSATSHMVGSNERSVAAALLNFFITLFGVGAGPLVTGVVSDLLTPVFGTQALRWSLVCVMLLMVPTALLLATALNPYRTRLTQMVPPAVPAA